MYLRSSDRNDLNVFFKFGTNINSAVAWITSMAKRIHSYCNLLLELDFPSKSPPKPTFGENAHAIFLS